MKISFAIICALSCMLLGAGQDVLARTAPLVEKSYLLDSKSAQTPEQVRDYILAGAGRYSELGYRIESDKPGALLLEFNKEFRHYVSVLFSYDNSGFKTTYVTSRNLDYSETNGVRLINVNYMEWLDEMFEKMKIAMALKLNAKGEPTDPNLASHVTFRAVGSDGYPVFSKTDETSDCGKLEKIGDAIPGQSDAANAAQRKEIDDWNELNKALIESGKAVRHRSGLVYPSYIEARRPIQIRGYTSSTVANRTTSCGPIVVGFTPLGSKKYTAEFSYLYGKCGLTIFDDTDPDLRVPVLPEEVKFKECKKRFLFF